MSFNFASQAPTTPAPGGATGFNFASTTPAAGGAAGAATAGASGFNFNSAAGTPGAASTPTANTGFNLNSTAGTPGATANTGFNFNATAGTPGATTPGFNMSGTGTPGTAASGFNMPGAGSATNSTTSGFNLPGAGSAANSMTSGFNLTGTGTGQSSAFNLPQATNAAAGVGATGNDFRRTYMLQSVHGDSQPTLEALAKMDWTYHLANNQKPGVPLNSFEFMRHFPFQYMFFDDFTTWHNSGSYKQLCTANGTVIPQNTGMGQFMSPQQQQQNNNTANLATFDNLLQNLKNRRIPYEVFIKRTVMVHMRAHRDYAHVKQALWEQALQTPFINGIPVVPRPVLGFKQLSARIQGQEARASDVQRLVRQGSTACQQMKSMLAATRQQIDSCRQNQLQLRDKLVDVIKKVELLHYWNRPQQESDVLLRERMNGLLSELSLPHQFRGQLAELQSQIDARKNLRAPKKKLHLSRIELQRVFDFLQQQQQGLATLTEIVRKDCRDLEIMRTRSLLARQNAQGLTSSQQPATGLR